MTRWPRSLAICAARLPTAPAAAETQTTSPSRSSAASIRPTQAVTAILPTEPRNFSGGASEVSTGERGGEGGERGKNPERGMAGPDHRVVTPAPGVRHRVVGRQSLGPQLSY